MKYLTEKKKSKTNVQKSQFTNLRNTKEKYLRNLLKSE